MTRDDVLEQWAAMAQGQADEGKLRAVGTWVAQLLARHPVDVCEIWLGQMHMAASSKPEVAVLPDVMGALMKAVCVDYGYDTRTSEARFVDAMRALAAKRESMGQREYILQLQALQREGGVPVCDGYNRRPVWAKFGTGDSATFREVREVLEPIHPGNLRECLDLLPDAYRLAAAEIERLDAVRDAEREPFDEFAPVSGYGALLEGVA